MRFFVPALLTSIVLTVGVLIVCWTSPTPSMFEFKGNLESPTHFLSTLEKFNLNKEYCPRLMRIATFIR